jgi:hypothetical protein
MAKPPGEFSFWGSDPDGGYDALQMRRQIAMQMLSQKKGYPKNIGEGLASIGDSLGDAAMMNSLAQQAAAERAKGTATGAAIYGGATPAPAHAGTARLDREPPDRAGRQRRPVNDPRRRRSQRAQHCGPHDGDGACGCVGVDQRG